MIRTEYIKYTNNYNYSILKESVFLEYPSKNYSISYWQDNVGNKYNTKMVNEFEKMHNKFYDLYYKLYDVSYDINFFSPENFKYSSIENEIEKYRVN